MSCRDWSADILDETPIYWCNEKSKGWYRCTPPPHRESERLRSEVAHDDDDTDACATSFVLCHNTSRMSSPMLTACSVGAVEAAEIFGLAYPPCLTIENNVRESTIHVAAMHGQLEILRLLKRLIPPDDFLEAVTAKTKFGLSSFGSAVRGGQIEAAYLLLRWGGLSSGGSRNKAVWRASVRLVIRGRRDSQDQYALKNAPGAALPHARGLAHLLGVSHDALGHEPEERGAVPCGAGGPRGAPGAHRRGLLRGSGRGRARARAAGR